MAAYWWIYDYCHQQAIYLGDQHRHLWFSGLWTVLFYLYQAIQLGQAQKCHTVMQQCHNSKISKQDIYIALYTESDPDLTLPIWHVITWDDTVLRVTHTCLYSPAVHYSINTLWLVTIFYWPEWLVKQQTHPNIVTHRKTTEAQHRVNIIDRPNVVIAIVTVITVITTQPSLTVNT